MRVVLDTSILVAAARSKKGTSFALVSTIPSPQYQICLSVGLYCEWLSVLQRPNNIPIDLTVEDVHGFLRFLASQAHLQNISFLWRPFLSDSNDDMILELAVAARCPYILTHNVKDFAGSDQFGVQALTPRKFLETLNNPS
ncbi:MAG: putative toxin-antitoxin system toxin component, PIN family [Verrucomicrobia bacterium]|nr:putative toxin-antitoxin system toxin component, PIN family [Verrucomicrobiota bacterium]